MGYSSHQKRPKGLRAILQPKTNEIHWWYYAPTTSENVFVASYSYENKLLTFYCVGYTNTMTTTKCIRSVFEDLLPGKVVSCFRNKGKVYVNGLEIPFNIPFEVFSEETQQAMMSLPQ